MDAGLLQRLSKSATFRRGSAWGLAGLVKGLGIGSLKTFGILERIKDATEDQVNLHTCNILIICCNQYFCSTFSLIHILSFAQSFLSCSCVILIIISLHQASALLL